NYSEAVFHLEDCCHQDSSNAGKRLKWAECLMAWGDWSQAKQQFHQIEEDHPHLVQRSLAYIYETEQNIPKAIRYNSALALMYPGDGQYIRKIAQLYISAQNPLEAEAAFTKALSMNRRDIAAWQGLGEVLMVMGNLPAADSAFVSAMEIDSQRLSLLLSYARLKYKRKEYSSVVDLLSKTEEQMDLPVHYQNMLAYAYIQTGDPEK